MCGCVQCVNMNVKCECMWCVCVCEKLSVCVWCIYVSVKS